jgi:hypothetical protein
MWVTQRFCEFIIITKVEEASPVDPDNYNVPWALKLTLFISNFAELGLEIVLYVQLIIVICNMNMFIKSFEQSNFNGDDFRLIKNSKNIFCLFTVNISIMMLTDSLFSLLTPYFWISDVFDYDSESYWKNTYDWFLQVFYIANTAFSLIMLYALHYFQKFEDQDNIKKDAPQKKRNR